MYESDSESDSLLLLINESSCDSRLVIIGGNVKAGSCAIISGVAPFFLEVLISHNNVTKIACPPLVLVCYIYPKNASLLYFKR